MSAYNDMMDRCHEAEAEAAKLRAERDRLRAALADVADDCAPPEHNFRCIACGAHHMSDDYGDLSYSVSRAYAALAESEGE